MIRRLANHQTRLFWGGKVTPGGHETAGGSGGEVDEWQALLGELSPVLAFTGF